MATKLDRDEQVGLWAMRGFILILAILFWWFGFCDDGTPAPGDESSLYDALHPAEWYNWIGVIMFNLLFVWFSLIFRTKMAELVVPAGSTWPNTVVLVLGFIGVPLMFA